MKHTMKTFSSRFAVALLLLATILIAACGQQPTPMGTQGLEYTGPTFTPNPYDASEAEATLPSFGWGGSASATPEAAEVAGDEWVTFTGDGFSLDLPGSFAAANSTEIPLQVNILAADGFTNMSVTKLEDAALASYTLQQAADETIAEYGNREGWTFLEQVSIDNAELEMTRLSVQAEQPTAPTIVVYQYLVLDGEVLWVLNYGTVEGSVPEWVDLFDESAASFTLVP